MAENNGITNVNELDKTKVQTAIDKFGADAVNQTLVDRGIEGAKTPAVDTITPVNEVKQEVDDKVVEEIKTPEPIIQDDQVKIPGVNALKVEVPKIDALKVEEVKPVTQIDTPVIDAQAIKSSELANQATETNLQDQKNIKTIANFEAALTTGNQQDLLSLTRQNPELRDTFNSLVKNQFKTKSDRTYFNKYASFSNEQLSSAVKSGDIVVGSEQYNSLPELQRASFNQFQTQENSIATSEDTKKQFETDNTQTLSLDSILTSLKDVFSSNLREQYEETMNSSEINSTAKDLEDKQNAINSLNDTIDDIGDDVRAQFPNLPASVQASIISDRTNKLNKDKNVLINEYNSKLGTYQSMKDQAQIDLDFLKYEDAQNKELYMTALGLYESRRSEMRADEKASLLERNKQIASDRSLVNQKELALFNQKLKENNLSGGKYIDNGKGDLVYIKNGEEISVLTGLGDASGTSEDVNYTYQVKTNDDGSYTVFGLPKKDGLNVYQETFDINGEQVVNWIKNTGTGKITSYGGNHDKFQGLDIDGNIGDPITIPLAGTVVEAQSHSAYGNTVVVKLSDGNKVRYSHLDGALVSVGDKIGKGGIVGAIGNTGNVLKLDGSKPTQAELKQGFGSHLDIVTTGPDGRVRSSKETETYLNNIGIGDEKVKPLTKQQTVFFNQQLSRFRSDPQVKAFESALASGGDLIQSLGSVSGPGDVAAIFQFMKTLDPASVVRESEFEVAAGTAGISAKPGILLGKISSGTRLNQEQRDEFGRLAFAYIKNKGKLYDIKYNDMSRALGTSGITGEVLPTRITDTIELFEQKETKGTTTTPSGYTIDYSNFNTSNTTNSSSYSGFWATSN